MTATSRSYFVCCLARRFKEWIIMSGLGRLDKNATGFLDTGVAAYYRHLLHPSQKVSGTGALLLDENN